jgi:hypothetical protein
MWRQFFDVMTLTVEVDKNLRMPYGMTIRDHIPK